MMLTAALALWAGAALAGPFGGHPAVFTGLAVLTVAAAVLVALTDTELVRAHGEGATLRGRRHLRRSAAAAHPVSAERPDVSSGWQWQAVR